MVVSCILHSGRDLVSLIGHRNRVGFLEFSVEQAIEGTNEVNR